MQRKISIIIIILLMYPFTASFAQGTLSLNEVIKAALDSNIQTRIQAYELAKAENRIKEQRSYMLPEIRANGSLDHYFDRQVIFLLDGPSGTRSSLKQVPVGGKNALVGSVTIAQPILNLTLAKQKQVVNVSRDIERVKLRQSKNDLALAVAKLYLTVVLYDQQMLLLENSLSRNEKALKDSKMLFEQGGALKTDTLNNYIALLNVRSAIATLKSNIQVAKFQLNDLVGYDICSDRKLSDTTVLETDIFGLTQDQNLVAAAVTGNPTFQINQLNIALAKKEEQLTKSLNKPQLMAMGQYMLQSQSDQPFAGQLPWPQTTFMGLRLSMPIYSGGRHVARQSNQRINTEQSRLRAEEYANSLRTRISDLTLKLNESKEQRRIAAQSVQAAKSSYEIATELYENGVNSRLELSEAELSLTRAQLNYSLAMYTVRITEFELLNVTGSK